MKYISLRIVDYTKTSIYLMDSEHLLDSNSYNKKVWEPLHRNYWDVIHISSIFREM